PTDDFATIYVDYLPGDIGGILRCQKNVRRSKLVRIACAPHRSLLAELFQVFLVKRRRNQRRPHWPRGNGIYTDTIPGEIFRQRSCERNDGTLRRRIVNEMIASPVCRNRRCINNASARVDLLQNFLCEIKKRKHIHVEGSL